MGTVASSLFAIFILRAFWYRNGYTQSPFSSKPITGVPQGVTPRQLAQWLTVNNVGRQF